MIKRIVPLLVLMIAASISPAKAAGHEIPLAGNWQFALDPQTTGVKEGWFQKDLADTIPLPGTTDEAKKGPGNTDKTETNHLSRPYPYVGVAWYQKEVQIPAEWKDERICLFLERTKYTTVWVDNVCFGDQNSLATPHVYELTSALTPGPHRLTIAIDNAKLPPLSGHQINENTQTNWNGVIGRLALVASDKVWIDGLRFFPDVANHRVRIRMNVGNIDPHFAAGQITLSAKSAAPETGGQLPAQTVQFDHVRNGDGVEANYELGANARLWSEFSPARYTLTATLQADAGGKNYSDRVERNFGLREFTTQGTQFTINGQPVLLRGRVDCCVFPLTGYPPAEVEAWMRVFQIYKEYGLNYNRCHTYCPPEAAFEAADRLGIYLQPELPYIGPALGSDRDAQQYARDEGERILKTYGSHPSLVMFSAGNEIANGRAARAAVVKRLRSFDPTRLYVQASNYDYNNPHFAVGDDYWTTMRTKNGLAGNVRGSYANVNLPLGFVQTGPPATTVDYTEAIRDVPVPVIGHEVGQYEMFPDFTEIPKYTGVLKPWNMEVYRDRVKKAGLLDQSSAFARASGALAVICYRADIEAAMRTEGFGGFDLLDLMDFPGQGLAIDGILNDLMESKGLITPREWRNFCAPVVPLALMPRRAWTHAQTFAAEVKVANYGPAALEAVPVAWSLQTNDHRVIAAGELTPRDAPQGAVSELGTISASLENAPVPSRLNLSLVLKGTPYETHYAIWVYPVQVDDAPPPDVTISTAWDADTISKLEAGGKVLLLPQLDKLANSIDGAFASDFWCYPMFLRIAQMRKMQPAAGTLGLLCDPAHPALARFPTESHSDWQWFSIVMHSKSLILDQAPPALHPIVQVIDNAARSHKLALIFEAAIGKGKLLVCTADLLHDQDDPAPRQLLSSLLAYAGSDQFHPVTPLSPEQAKNLFQVESPSAGSDNATRGLKDDRDAFPMLRH